MLETALAEDIREVDRSDEATLVVEARRGSRQAFAALVERHMRRAYFAALGLVGTHEDALDMSQEAFARAFRARASIDPGRSFYTWYYAILRNLCFNFIRNRRTRREKLVTAAGWLVDTASAQAAERSPDRTVEREEARRRVTAALEQLSERDREVLVLKEFEGLRYREIAALLDIPVGTVMSRLYAARRGLAQALEDAEVSK